MTDDLGLSLDSVREKKKDRSGIILALLVIVVVLLALRVFFMFTGGGPGESDPAVLEKLALTLEERELHGAAADTWVEYLRTGGAGGDEERARIWYRIGRNREKAGDCERALAAYYRSEETAALGELEQEISMAAERCLTRLAKFAALRAEVAGRTAIGDGEGKGAEVLAEIGSEKITRGELERMIEAEVDAQVEQMAAGLPDDQVRAQREKLLDQVMKETDLAQWLENLVADELLFRYAMEEGLHEDREIVEMSRRMERRLLTSQVLAREYAAKVSVTEQEARDWYAQNGQRLAARSGEEGGKVPPFEEVRDRAFAALRMEKERAVQAELLEKLTDRYDVVIHRSRLDTAKEKEAAK